MFTECCYGDRTSGTAGVMKIAVWVRLRLQLKCTVVREFLAPKFLTALADGFFWRKCQFFDETLPGILTFVKKKITASYFFFSKIYRHFILGLRTKVGAKSNSSTAVSYVTNFWHPCSLSKSEIKYKKGSRVVQNRYVSKYFKKFSPPPPIKCPKLN